MAGMDAPGTHQILTISSLFNLILVHCKYFTSIRSNKDVIVKNLMHPTSLSQHAGAFGLEAKYCFKKIEGF